MHFFTPELYRKFNSPDDEEADQADAAWEEAIRNYRRRLDEIRERLPSPVGKLAALSLHDAEVLSRVEVIQQGGPFFPAFPFPFPIPVWSAVAIVTVRQDADLLSLIYCLCDRLRTIEGPADWPFSKEREHWLYDEVDVLSERLHAPFVHRILLSTGVELEIPFTSVVIHQVALPEAEAGGKARQRV
jgi:hypothetical protein